MQYFTDAKLASTNYYYNRNMTRDIINISAGKLIRWERTQRTIGISSATRSKKAEQVISIKSMGITDFSSETDPESAGTPIPNLSLDPPHPRKPRPPFGALPMARNDSVENPSIEG